MEGGVNITGGVQELRKRWPPLVHIFLRLWISHVQNDVTAEIQHARNHREGMLQNNLIQKYGVDAHKHFILLAYLSASLDRCAYVYVYQKGAQHSPWW